MITIDGKNIETTYGCYVSEEGIYDLLSTAPIKPPKENDWYERNGVEVDTSGMYLQSRKLSIELISTSLDGRRRLVESLISGQVVTIKHHTGISRTCKFIAVTDSEFEEVGDFVLLFEELEPSAPIAIPEEIPRIAGEMSIDGKPLSKYGIIKLSGERELRDIVDMKSGLQVSQMNAHGDTYYKQKTPHTKKREATLELFTSGDNAIKNYQALIAQFLKDGEHNIDGKKCYYKEARVTEFDEAIKPVWLTFRLTIVLYD